MRAIRITLKTGQPFTLPLAYNELVQGLLYSCWRESFPDLHDKGLGGKRPLRLFTFGPLQGKHLVDSQAKTIQFLDTVSLEVRTPIEELLDELAHQLGARRAIRLGGHELKLVNLQACDRLVFPQRAVIRMQSAAVAYRTTGDRHTQYYSPEDREWLELMQANAQRKAELLCPDLVSNIAIIPQAETLHKRVTKFKGTYVTGWTGDMIIAAEPLLLSVLYYTGIGAKNSQGFGLFDILDTIV